MKTLLVQFYGHTIGELLQTPEGRIEFTYNSSWLEAKQARPLSQSLPLRRETFNERACIGFFGGLLPEEYNREIIAKNLGITAGNDFAMLRAIGGECAGAVALLDPNQSIEKSTQAYEPITDEELIKILDQLPQKPLLAGRTEVRLSLAGAQNKIALFKKGDRFSLPLNESPSTHILKPELERFPDLTTNEAYCLNLANDVGLPTAQSKVKKYGPHRCLVIKRYDRTSSEVGELQRLHQEDFCQALGIPARIKYQAEGGPSLEHCFQLVRSAASRPARDLIHLFNAVTFNYLIGNNDAHGKNFSLLYTTSNQSPIVQLAPLYDLVSTTYYPQLSSKMAMKIGRNSLPEETRRSDWESYWSVIGFSQKQALKQTLQFIEKMESQCHSPDGQIQKSIQIIVKTRIQNLRSTIA
ncbi:MAG: serine/threonine-protein kinase HipA [Candidatus Pelagisphaera sp.]|jgi:serine/threonine-protein kinase HipA